MLDKMNKEILDRVINLLEKYVNNDISANVFKNRYFRIRRFMRDSNISFPEEFENIFDQIFSDCDLYESNIKIRTQFTIDEKALLNLIKKDLSDLRKLIYH